MVLGALFQSGGAPAIASTIQKEYKLHDFLHVLMVSIDELQAEIEQNSLVDFVARVDPHFCVDDAHIVACAALYLAPKVEQYNIPSLQQIFTTLAAKYAAAESHDFREYSEFLEIGRLVYFDEGCEKTITVHEEAVVKNPRMLEVPGCIKRKSHMHKTVVDLPLAIHVALYPSVDLAKRFSQLPMPHRYLIPAGLMRKNENLIQEYVMSTRIQ